MNEIFENIEKDFEEFIKKGQEIIDKAKENKEK